MSYSDYIVVGGGAAGCALVSQLLKSSNEVSLFEAGYSHHIFLLDVPAGFFKLINDSKYLIYHKVSFTFHHSDGSNCHLILPRVGDTVFVLLIENLRSRERGKNYLRGEFFSSLSRVEENVYIFVSFRIMFDTLMKWGEYFLYLQWYPTGDGFSQKTPEMNELEGVKKSLKI